jgi:hypothetical protein
MGMTTPEELPEFEQIESNPVPDIPLEAYQIAGTGDIDIMVKELHRTGLYEQVRRSLETRYGPALSDLPYIELTEKDWDLLVCTSLYEDIPAFAENTLMHEIDTAKRVAEKLEKPLRLPDGSTIVLTDAMAMELEPIAGSRAKALEIAMRSFLHHDVGKTAIPRSIFECPYTPDDFLDFLADAVINRETAAIDHLALSPDEELATKRYEQSKDCVKKTLVLHLRDHGQYAKDVTPVCDIFGPEALRELEARGFDLDSTFSDLLRAHEKKTGEILRGANFPLEAELAERHHNYDGKPVRFHVTTSAGSIAAHHSGITEGDVHYLYAPLTDVHHIADMESALLQNRVYSHYQSAARGGDVMNGGEPLLRTLAILAEEATGTDGHPRHIDPNLCYAWLVSEIEEKVSWPVFDTYTAGDDGEPTTRYAVAVQRFLLKTKASAETTRERTLQ